MKKKNLMCSLSIILATIALTSCKRPSDCSVTSSSTTSSQTTSSSSSSTHTHSYSKWEVTKKPTLEETGTIERKCTSNDDTDTFTLPKLNETDYIYTVVTASTCVTKGTGKYTYNKDGQDLEFTVELEIDIDNHASLDSNGKCTDCYEYQGLHYSFDETNKTCSVMGVGFQTYDEETSTYYSHSPKNVVIPEKITKGTNEYTVTSIYNSAFANCTTLESIKIPSCVTSIRNEAFYGCTSLKSIVIPSSVTSIGYYVFESCTSLESIVVEKGNTTYTSRNSSGEECNAIIKKADNSLITGCKNTVIPNTVTSISQYAFYGCKSLKTIEIPSSVTIIQERAFSWCTSLESITIPNSVTSIGDSAFDECASLKSIVIPSSVTSIGSCVFDSCTSLESIVVEKDNTTYDSRDNCNAIIKTATNTLLEGCKNTVIPKTVSKIGQNAFYECTSLETIEIPSSVTQIEQKAFYGCISLKSIVIPDGVTSIGDYVFYGCTSLGSINISTSVTSIGDETFRGCTSLKSIVIPSSVTSIGDYVFESCTSLESIVVEKGNTTYDSKDNCNAIIETSTNTLLEGCKNTVIPNTVTIIGSSAFSGRSLLETITIPIGVKTINSSAFYRCTSLKSINISNTVTAIGQSAFHDCTSLRSLVIPRSVSIINYYMVAGCTSLESIVVEEGNTTYDSRDNCNAIISKADNTLLIGCKTTIIPDSVTSIGKYAFYICPSLESIEIPNSVTIIDNYAFSECSSLKSIEIPSSVTSIETNAFNRCLSLKSVIISGSATAIKDYAFYKCITLKSIIVLKDIATISTTAFYGIAESIDVFVDGSYEDGVSDALTNIFGDRLIYRSNDRPTDITHSYWHYVDGKPVKW